MLDARGGRFLVLKRTRRSTSTNQHQHKSAQILSLYVAAHFQVISMISLKVGFLVAFSAALLQVIWMISLEWAGTESDPLKR